MRNANEATPIMNVSDAGLDLIERFEGYLAHPARMPDGRIVVGIGHVVNDNEPSRPLSLPEARAQLRADVAAAETAVSLAIRAKLPQPQFDALVSLAFSIGPELFASSDAAKRIGAGEVLAAADAFDTWRKSGLIGAGEVSPELVMRRTAEKALFLSAVTPEPAPSALLRPAADYAFALVSAPRKSTPAPALSLGPIEPQPAAALEAEDALAAAPPRKRSRPSRRLEAATAKNSAPLMALGGFGFCLIGLGAVLAQTTALSFADAALLFAGPAIAAIWAAAHQLTALEA